MYLVIGLQCIAMSICTLVKVLAENSFILTHDFLLLFFIAVHFSMLVLVAIVLPGAY